MRGLLKGVRGSLTSDERGDTLVEVLVAVVIIGLAATAILGSLLLSISSSGEHRYLANDDTLARSAIESIKQQVELPQSSSGVFVDCSASTTLAGSPPTGTAQVILQSWTGTGAYKVTLPGLPPGYANYSVAITGVQCYNASSGKLDGSCYYTTIGVSSVTPSSCASDTSGLLQVTVTVKDPSGYSLNLSTIVRNPSYQSGYNSGMFS